jgi:hypothetical protein
VYGRCTPPVRRAIAVRGDLLVPGQWQDEAAAPALDRLDGYVILTKIAADEQAETWTPVASLNLAQATGRGPVCVIFRADGDRAYASLFGPAGGIAIVDVPTMALVGTLPTAGSVSGCGLVNSNDGRTIFLHSAGGTGHFYRLDTWTDTLYEDTSYGPIGFDLHGLAVTANEKTAYITARGVADEIKVLNLNGTDVSTILIDPRPGVRIDPTPWRGRAATCTSRCASRAKSPGSKRRQAAWSTSMWHHPRQPVMRFMGSPFDLDSVFRRATRADDWECPRDR